MGDYDQLLLRIDMFEGAIHYWTASIFAYLDLSRVPTLVVLGVFDYKEEHGHG